MIPAVLGLAACVSTGPKLPVSVQPSLSPMRNLVDSAGKALPVRIALHLVDHQAKPTVIVGHGSAGVTPTERQQAFNLVGWGYNAIVVDHYTARESKFIRAWPSKEVCLAIERQT